MRRGGSGELQGSNERRSSHRSGRPHFSFQVRIPFEDGGEGVEEEFWFRDLAEDRSSGS